MINKPTYGYHKRQIQKQKVGTVSKIYEELEEFEDALEQGNKVMAVVELSDVVLAIQNYLDHNKIGITVEELVTMARATERAFLYGSRK